MACRTACPAVSDPSVPTTIAVNMRTILGQVASLTTAMTIPVTTATTIAICR